MNSKILVVDDEENICELMTYVLQEEGHTVATAKDGREGLKALFSWQPSLVVLDLMMPQMDGWTLLDRIREVSEAPVIVVSALGEEGDKVRALRSGADDYITKPLRISEFLARVDAALRKAKDTPQVKEEYKDPVLQVDFPHHYVYVNGHKLDLSPTEFRLLSALVRNASVVLSPDRLLDLCWKEGEGGPENVRVYVGYLRRKLEEFHTTAPLIETVREFGYRYCPPLTGNGGVPVPSPA